MTYLLSDVHGCYAQWREMLHQISLKDSDDVFVLGDVLDRGPEPMRLLMDLMERSNVFPLMGNHEYIFLQCVAKLPAEVTIDNFMEGYSQEEVASLAIWMYSGGRTSFEQYLALTAEEKVAVQDYLLDLPLYEEICVNDRDFLLTHSGLHGFRPERDIDDYSAQDFLFDRPQADSVYFPNKTLVFGHTPTFHYLNHPAGQILQTKTFINLDCGSVYPQKGGRLGCLRLEDQKCFYT